MLALAVEPEQRALFAALAQLERIDRVEIFDAEVFERLVLDRKPVHIPARYELGVLSVQQSDLHEHVLEHHAEEMPHVKLAVGVRRPVV